MTIPPVSRKRVTQLWLNQQFDDNGWIERLAQSTKAERHNSLTPAVRGEPVGTLTIAHEYYDADQRIAMVLFYLRPDGTLGASGRKTPKGLLIDGGWYFI